MTGGARIDHGVLVRESSNGLPNAQVLKAASGQNARERAYCVRHQALPPGVRGEPDGDDPERELDDDREPGEQARPDDPSRWAAGPAVARAGARRRRSPASPRGRAQSRASRTAARACPGRGARPPPRRSPERAARRRSERRGAEDERGERRTPEGDLPCRAPRELEHRLRPARRARTIADGDAREPQHAVPGEREEREPGRLRRVVPTVDECRVAGLRGVAIDARRPVEERRHERKVSRLVASGRLEDERHGNRDEADGTETREMPRPERGRGIRRPYAQRPREPQVPGLHWRGAGRGDGQRVSVGRGGRRRGTVRLAAGGDPPLGRRPGRTRRPGGPARRARRGGAALARLGRPAAPAPARASAAVSGRRSRPSSAS